MENLINKIDKSMKTLHFICLILAVMAFRVVITDVYARVPAPASVVFWAKPGQNIQVWLNGYALNSGPASLVRSRILQAGSYQATIWIWGRNRTLRTYQTWIRLNPGLETGFSVSRFQGNLQMQFLGYIALDPNLYQSNNYYSGSSYNRQNQDSNQNNDNDDNSENTNQNQYGGQNNYQNQQPQQSQNQYGQQNQNQNHHQNQYQNQNLPAKPASSTLNQSQIAQLAQQIKLARFDSERMSIAKAAINANFLYTNDIGSLIKELAFEDNKLALAKLAYSRCLNPQNYAEIYKHFKFSESTDQLDAYIESVRK